MNARRGTRGAWLPWAFAGALLFVAAFAPLLANDVPLAARVDGHWSFPAFAELLGAAPPGPGDQTWQQWAAARPPDSADRCWFAPWPHGPLATDLQHVCGGPSLAHPLGHDDTGRDVLARIVRGTRPAVGLAVLGVALGALLGCALGGLAGLCGGAVDVLVLRLVELLLCFPLVLLLLAIAAFFGDSVLGIVVVFGLATAPSFARIVRGELLSLRERDFVLAARGLGVPGHRILLFHLLPQLRGQVAVTAAFCTAQAIVAESTLSFLGLGPGTPSGSWGSILAQGRQNAHLGVWHLWCFPGLAILLTVMCCHALADRLRPRT